MDFFRGSILIGYITMMSIVVMNFIDWLYQHLLTNFWYSKIVWLTKLVEIL